jgi:hypothetical protein
LSRRSRNERPRPKRHCRSCGADVYSFAEAPLCALCTEAEVASNPGWVRRAQLDAGNLEP